MAGNEKSGHGRSFHGAGSTGLASQILTSIVAVKPTTVCHADEAHSAIDQSCHS
jgi:hypothetical protein